MSSEESRGRPKLNLKPRDEAAAAKAAEDRAKAPKSNPFGQAKPRESILAGRSGKREEDILKDELSKDRLRLRLTQEQNSQQEAAAAEITELEEAYTLEEEDSKKTAIKDEIAKKRAELDDMLTEFEKLAVARAKSGEGVRPSERRRLAEEREQGAPTAGGGVSGYGAPQSGSRGGYGNGDYSYGNQGSGNSFNSRPSRQGSYNSSGNKESQSSFGGGYKQASNGSGGYNEPLAQGYERSLPEGGHGAHDIFAGGQADSYAQQGPGSSRGQDRF